MSRQSILDKTRILTPFCVPDYIHERVCIMLIGDDDAGGDVITTVKGLPTQDLLKSYCSYVFSEVDSIAEVVPRDPAKTTNPNRGKYRKCLLRRLAVCEFVDNMSKYNKTGIRRPWSQLLPAWNKAHPEDTFGSIASMKRQVILWWSEYVVYRHFSASARAALAIQAAIHCGEGLYDAETKTNRDKLWREANYYSAISFRYLNKESVVAYEKVEESALELIETQVNNDLFPSNTKHNP